MTRAARVAIAAAARLTAGVAIAAGAAAITAALAAAEPLPRVEHVTQALAAVRGLGPTGRDQLDRALYVAARERCGADTAVPAASCLIAAARAVCASDADRPRCEAAADVIVANLRAVPAWIDEPTRFRLVRGSADYRAALAAELHRRHAALAAELVLSGTARSTAPSGRPGDPATAGEAAAIDRLCVRRDRAIHACPPGDAACVPSLPWSRCIAALVWFIGGGA